MKLSTIEKKLNRKASQIEMEIFNVAKADSTLMLYFNKNMVLSIRKKTESKLVAVLKSQLRKLNISLEIRTAFNISESKTIYNVIVDNQLISNDYLQSAALESAIAKINPTH